MRKRHAVSFARAHGVATEPKMGEWGTYGDQNETSCVTYSLVSEHSDRDSSHAVVKRHTVKRAAKGMTVFTVLPSPVHLHGRQKPGVTCTN